MFDFLKIIGKLSEIKDKSREIKERLAFMEIIYTSECGRITVYATANKEIKKINIDPALFTAEAKTDVEDKLKKAINASIVRCSEKAASEMKEGLKDSLPDIPGFDVEKLFG